MKSLQGSGRHQIEQVAFCDVDAGRIAAIPVGEVLEVGGVRLSMRVGVHRRPGSGP